MSFLDLIPRWVLLAALAAAAAFGALQTVRLTGARLALGAEKTAHMQTQRDHAKQFQALAESARDTTAKWLMAYAQQSKRLQEIADARRTEDASHRHIADALRADRERLRGELAAYAAGSGEPAGDSAAACQARAAILADVLAEGVRLHVELAEAAESHLADARALYDGWQALKQSSTQQTPISRATTAEPPSNSN